MREEKPLYIPQEYIKFCPESYTRPRNLRNFSPAKPKRTIASNLINKDKIWDMW